MPMRGMFGRSTTPEAPQAEAPQIADPYGFNQYGFAPDQNQQQQFGGFQSYLPDQGQQQQVEALDQGFQAFNAQQQPLLQQQTQQADLRALATQNQLEQAGLLNLAEQFRRGQSMNTSDAARRGRLGGSYQMGKETEMAAQAERGVGDVLSQAGSMAEQQRMAELAPVFGFQQQLAGGDQFSQMGRGMMMEDLGQRAQGAQGQFGLNQMQQEIAAGLRQNQAENIGGIFSGAAQGLQGGIQGWQNQQYMDSMRQMYNPWTPMTPPGRNVTQHASGAVSYS